MPRSRKATPKHKSDSKKIVAKRVRAVVTAKVENASGKSRAEGVRLFALAGRPSKDDFVKVYGPAGPKMTWEQRAKAGVPAEKFQAALAAKHAGR
jgi:hypothetical protein